MLTAKIFYLFQQMEPAKQAKVMKEFQKQSAQMDMTVKFSIVLLDALSLMFLKPPL